MTKQRRVLFSNPPWWEPPERGYHRAGVRSGSRWPFTSLVRSSPDNFVWGDYLPYPFFMGYAASYADLHTDCQVAFQDSIALRESYKSYFESISDGDYDYIFIESATPSWPTDERIIAEIHARCPQTKIVITGPITTTKGHQILEHYPVWACIRGEYEKGSVRVLNGEHGLIDFDLLTEAEMNEAPWPVNHETYAHRYWDANPRGQIAPQAQVWSSRGCPYKCCFCVWPAAMTGNDPDGTGKRTVRHYKPEYIELMLAYWKERYGYRCVYFDDDTFNLGDKHVIGICEVMKRIALPWSAMCRADTIKPETWGLMKESGCFGVKIGFESGNQYVVDKIVNKHLDLEKARETVHLLKRLGMTVHGTFTYGLPGETPEQMQDTKLYIASLPLDTFQESGTAEIEGTPLYTLRMRGHLDKYPGAVCDKNYEVHADGGKKMHYNNSDG